MNRILSTSALALGVILAISAGTLVAPGGAQAAPPSKLGATGDLRLPPELVGHRFWAHAEIIAPHIAVLTDAVVFDPSMRDFTSRAAREFSSQPQEFPRAVKESMKRIGATRTGRMLLSAIEARAAAAYSQPSGHMSVRTKGSLPADQRVVIAIAPSRGGGTMIDPAAHTVLSPEGVRAGRPSGSIINIRNDTLPSFVAPDGSRHVESFDLALSRQLLNAVLPLLGRESRSTSTLEVHLAGTGQRRRDVRVEIPEWDLLAHGGDNERAAVIASRKRNGQAGGDDGLPFNPIWRDAAVSTLRQTTEASTLDDDVVMMLANTPPTLSELAAELGHPLAPIAGGKVWVGASASIDQTNGRITWMDAGPRFRRAGGVHDADLTATDYASPASSAKLVRADVKPRENDGTGTVIDAAAVADLRERRADARLDQDLMLAKARIEMASMPGTSALSADPVTVARWLFVRSLDAADARRMAELVARARIARACP